MRRRADELEERLLEQESRVDREVLTGREARQEEAEAERAERERAEEEQRLRCVARFVDGF